MHFQTKSKTILITGTTSGIGLELAKQLAKLGCINKDKIVIVGRNLAKVQAAIEEIESFSGNSNIDYLLADLSLMSEVKKLAAQIDYKYPKLDILINNAGVYLPNLILTQENFEMTMATNYLSPFLLTNLLIEKLEKSEQAKIINVSSGAYRFGQIDLNNFPNQQDFDGSKAYSNSKLGLLYFNRQLAKKLEKTKITTNAFNPGKVATNLNRHLKIQPASDLTALQGADTGLWLATETSLDKTSGKYFTQRELLEIDLDSQTQTELWDFTKKLLQIV